MPDNVSKDLCFKIKEAISDERAAPPIKDILKEEGILSRAREKVIVSKALCSKIKEAISDERSAPPMYRGLKDILKEEGILSRAREKVIDSIIEEEENHERIFVMLAEQVGCDLSTREKKRIMFADLPLAERVKIARGYGRD